MEMNSIAVSDEVIEEAADSLATLSPFIRTAQRKELHSFGDQRAQDIGASGISKDFQIGYELGLQAARQFLAGDPEAVIAKVNF
jgi:hypothetical protein